jgi:hypothetical protein
MIDSKGMKGLTETNGLWYIGSQLLIPRYRDIHENIFRLTHDTLGHFGADKSYAAIRDSYYWPNMHHDLEDAYVPGCEDCQRNKARTTRPTGLLHPLPVPDQHRDSVGLDFIGPLLEDNSYDCIFR